MFMNKVNKRGMTLIEVLFSTAIFAFVSITLFALFKLGQTYWAKGISYNILQSEGKRIINLLQQDIKESDINRVDDTKRSNLLINNILIENQMVSRDTLILAIPNPDYPRDWRTALARVYFANLERKDSNGGTGKLFLYEFRPATATQDIFSIVTGISDFVNPTNPSPNKISLLSDNLFSFRARRNLNDTVRVDLVLLRKSIGDNKINTVSFNLEIMPMNNNQYPFDRR